MDGWSPAWAGTPDTPEQQVCALLVEQGRLHAGDLDRGRRLLAESPDTRLPHLLTKLGLVSERDLVEAWAQTLHVPVLAAADAPEQPPDASLAVRFMQHHHLVPVAGDADMIRIATVDPDDTYLQQAVHMATGRTVEVVVATRSDIDQLIENWYGSGRSTFDTIVEGMQGEAANPDVDDIEQLRELASEAPVIRLVNLLIQHAVRARASDIHVEPFETSLKVRFRVDGMLRDVDAPPARSTAAVISRIKIMAGMDIAERRRPQDGRIMARIQGKQLDLRVSSLPTAFGESVVMRLLDREQVVLDFPALGFDDATLPVLREALAQPHGIVLVTGPTGSGKTTTLYTALARLNTPERKIITVEDPVEYHLDGINQMQVKPDIGLTFAQALRSIVRQDPDVIMVGEMRDAETARIAIRSALTGHLVLSTLHTNSAAGALTRLLDMGVADYLIASTVHVIVAQRLVRRLDPSCAEAWEPPPERIAEWGLASLTDERPIRLWRPAATAGTDRGFHGRLAIIEQLRLDDAVHDLLMRHAGTAQIEQAARQAGMRSMYADGMRKALAGVTTVDEVLRVTGGG